MSERDVSAVSGTRRGIRELADGTVRVQIDIDPAFRRVFFEMFPDIDSRVALAPLVPESKRRGDGEAEEGAGATSAPPASEPRAPGPNRLAQRLVAGGFFGHPVKGSFSRLLWDAMAAADVYTPKMHKTWIEQQTCEGALLASEIVCNGEVCAHHTPSAALPAGGSDAENPRKVEDWFTVPLCYRHHGAWAHGSGQYGATRAQKGELVLIAVRTVAERMKDHFKELCDLESLSELTPQVFVAVCQQLDVPASMIEEYVRER